MADIMPLKQVVIISNFLQQNKLKSLKVAQKHGCPGVVYDYVCDVACDGEGMGNVECGMIDFQLFGGLTDDCQLTAD